MIESIEGLQNFGDQIITRRDGSATDSTDNTGNTPTNAEPFEKDTFAKYVTDVLKVKKQNFNSADVQEFSEYFLIESRTKLGTGTVKLYSIIYREENDAKSTRLIMQTSGAL